MEMLRMSKQKPFLEWDEHPTQLEFKDFVPIGRLIALGTKTRINHNSKYCQGESKSLQIRRLRNGVIGAKCFRCGRYGVFKKDKEAVLPKKVDGRWFKDISYDEVQNKPLALPKDLELEWDKWPVEAKSFLRHARLDEVDTFIRNIGYSPSLEKVVLPLYNNGRNLIGYQLRRIFKEDTAPKYTTRKNAKDYFSFSHKTDNVCVVVEDYLSFIRCSKYVSTVCLFGTSMSHSVVKKLSGFDRVIVFLDNDNNIVKKKQQEMKKELELWINEVLIISSRKQPKEYTNANLVMLIDVPF